MDNSDEDTKQANNGNKAKKKSKSISDTGTPKRILRDSSLTKQKESDKEEEYKLDTLQDTDDDDDDVGTESIIAKRKQEESIQYGKRQIININNPYSIMNSYIQV